MQLTPAQSATLRAFIDATPALASQPNTTDGAMTIASLMDTQESPDFWVYATSRSEADYTTKDGPDGTTWNWQAYMTRNQGERDGWARLFATETVNPSRANVRNAFDEIFSATGIAAVQKIHCQSINRRKATVAEKLFAVGTGSAASPAMLGPDAYGRPVEGKMDVDDILAARAV